MVWNRVVPPGGFTVVTVAECRGPDVLCLAEVREEPVGPRPQQLPKPLLVPSDRFWVGEVDVVAPPAGVRPARERRHIRFRPDARHALQEVAALHPRRGRLCRSRHVRRCPEDDSEPSGVDLLDHSLEVGMLARHQVADVRLPIAVEVESPVRQLERLDPLHVLVEKRPVELSRVGGTHQRLERPLRHQPWPAGRLHVCLQYVAQAWAEEERELHVRRVEGCVVAHLVATAALGTKVEQRGTVAVVQEAVPVRAHEPRNWRVGEVVLACQQVGGLVEDNLAGLVHSVKALATAVDPRLPIGREKVNFVGIGRALAEVAAGRGVNNGCLDTRAAADPTDPHAERGMAHLNLHACGDIRCDAVGGFGDVDGGGSRRSALDLSSDPDSH